MKDEPAKSRNGFKNRLRWGIDAKFLIGDLPAVYEFVTARLGGEAVFEAVMQGRRRHWMFDQWELLMEFADAFGWKKEK